jgi:two-component sensor histidine kinase
VGRISRFNNKDFLPVQNPSLKRMVSNLIADRTRYYWANPGLKDHNGEWWFATKEGLYRYPAIQRAEELATLQPKATYTIDGLQSNDLYAVFEDSRGDLWFSLFKQTGTAVCRWERASGKFYTYGKEYGLPSIEGVVSFAEDRQGNIWLGFSTKTSKNGILARYRGGQFQIFTKEDGVLDGTTRSLFVDHTGRLWVGSSQGGVGRVDDPQAAHPVIRQYTTADGLTDNEINCLTEDRWGNLYIGTGRGLDRLNPTTGQVRHFTAADGLLGTDVRKIYRDSRMNLWIGTGKGLFHFIPQEEAPKPAPSILITRLLVAGADRVISELGERQLADLELANNENNLQVDFVSPSVSFAPTIRYEYKLEGSNDQWLALSDLRTVNFANLSPGAYRFQVQAINSEGIRSPEPATIRFTILPPLWRRWWFLTLMALLVGAAITAIYHYRINRLLEIERVRTRIAADLHDDIGASLSHIAIVSEVARHQLAEQESPLSKNLSVIARISRDAVDSMSDIVWAVNPQRDHLYDLTRRMRSFASELLPARNIDFQFIAPPEEQDIRLGADVRRQLFLIYKESLNNVVRHSGCTRASIEMHIEGRRLVLKVSDNGKGFDTSNGVSGNGLRNMRKRAESLGGHVHFTSANGSGTVVILEMPHHPVHKFER